MLMNPASSRERVAVRWYEPTTDMRELTFPSPNTEIFPGG